MLYSVNMDKQDLDKVVIVPQQTTEKMPGSKTKKTVAIVAACLMGCVVVALTVSLPLYFFVAKSGTQITTENLYLNTPDGKKIEEKVVVNEEDNTEDIQTNDNGFRIIHDFNKGITVMIMGEDEGKCFVSQMNRSLLTPPTRNDYGPGVNNEENRQENSTNTIQMDYTVDKFTVSDHSMLSREAREMCKGRELHWLVLKTENKKVVRRAIYYYCYYYYYCRYISVYYYPYIIYRCSWIYSCIFF